MFRSFDISIASPFFAASLTLLVAGVASPCHGGPMLQSTDFYDASSSGAGNGTLDLRLFTAETAENSLKSAAYNGDDGNNSLPNGNPNGSFAESYVTTVGKVLDFYLLNFGTTAVELVLFFDINETMGGAAVNNILKVEIFLDPTGLSSTPTNETDLTGAEQDAINQTFTPGTLLAELGSTFNAALSAQGGGYADWYLRTGVSLAGLDRDQVLLFNISIVGP